ncbi:MAG: hypothetical protein CML03_08890 [Pseudooceanicola sp.]|nr:hypothetical protein [Pseudooceanicola sp.]
MSISQQIPREIKSVARCVGYAAWLDTTDAWLGLPVVMEARLEPHQRAALAYAALRTLTPEQVAAVANTVLPNSAGMPIAPFIDPVDEAAFWADIADPDELDAYAVAIFNAMSSAKKRAFRDFAGRAAA